MTMEISELKTEDIIKAIYDEKIDAALLVTPLYDDNIKERILFYERFCVFLAAGHRLTENKFINQSDLDPNEIWLLEEGHCFRDQVIKVCSLKKRPNVLKNINFSSGSMETLINLIRKGHGYTMLPELAADNLSKKEQSINLKYFAEPIPTREVSLIHSKRFIKKKVIEALEIEIKSCLPKGYSNKKSKRIEVIDI